MGRNKMTRAECISSQLLLLLLVAAILCLSGRVEPRLSRRSRPSTPSLEASCQKTRYPAICMQCLSIFPNSSLENQKQLAETALLASLFRADITRLSLREERDMMETNLASDCSGLIDAAHDSLTQSIVTLHNLITTGQGHESLAQRLREIRDWLTAAHYSNSYCLDEFTSENNMNNSTEIVRGRVLYQYQTTENAIDLFRRYARSLGVRF